MTNAIRHLAIVGATATGKTALAVSLARVASGVELVSVDAMAVYRGLDIGTAKPSGDERDRVTWHLLDVVDPAEEFSVVTFQRVARAAIVDIESRAKTAVLVGGTGLYHRAVIDDLSFPGRYRALAETLLAEAAAPGGEAALYRRLADLDPLAATRMEPTNTRRIVRALEVTLGSGRPYSSFGPGLEHYPPVPYHQVGLRLDRAELDRRIAERLEEELAAGFLEEVASLLERPGGLSRTARQALGYRELIAHLAGSLSLEEAHAEILRRTRAFARRQEAWFRRDPRVHWYDAGREDLSEMLLALLEDCERGRSDRSA